MEGYHVKQNKLNGKGQILGDLIQLFSIEK